MSQVLLYSRKSSPSVELLVEQLQLIGHQVDQTQSLNLPRLILNPYQIIHFLIDEFPLTVKENVFLGVVKSLGKGCVLSVLNFNSKHTKTAFEFLLPDALTVSQTNHLKHFRAWNCNKMILPYMPRFQSNLKPSAKTDLPCESYLVPLLDKLNEATEFRSNSDIYFDARKLLAKTPSSELRKNWNQLINTKKIKSNYHLILSDQKLTQHLNDESVAIILANPGLKHSEFNQWVELTANNNNLIILNDYQATSYSHAWTSGHNCYVVSYYSWLKDLNTLFANKPDLTIKTFFKPNIFVEPLINEISRLYTRILHQKTSLLSAQSANISK